MRAVSMAGVTVTLARNAKRKYVVAQQGTPVGHLYAAGNGWQATPLGGPTTTHLTIDQATFQVLSAAANTQEQQMENTTSTPAPTTPVDQITAFLQEFRDKRYGAYTVDAPTRDRAILELSGMVDSYYGGDSLTGDALLAGTVLCMVNRRLLRIQELLSGSGYSFQLTK